MRIYLIGFMGSGKSFTGKRLAGLLNIPFSDLDEGIEDLAKKTIPQIFKEEGESAFRAIEKEALHLTGHLPAAVVACGGGTPCFFDNMEWMNDHGICIYLKTAPKVLFDRLLGEKDYRPLLKELSDKELKTYIKEKVTEREVYYLKASVVYEQQSLNEDVAIQLMQQLPNITGH